MILFYRDYFFPADHADAGKPIPLGLCGQLGSRPHKFSLEWLEYKSLFVELELAGYSTISRNGDDPIQEHLRSVNYQTTDGRGFAELYRIGLARAGIAAAPASALEQVRALPRLVAYVQRTTSLLDLVNNLRRSQQQLQNNHAGRFAELATILQFAAKAKQVLRPQ